MDPSGPTLTPPLSTSLRRDRRRELPGSPVFLFVSELQEEWWAGLGSLKYTIPTTTGSLLSLIGRGPVPSPRKIPSTVSLTWTVHLILHLSFLTLRNGHLLCLFVRTVPQTALLPSPTGRSSPYPPSSASWNSMVTEGSEDPME